jgi:Ca2+/Na+ antiporter
LEGWVRAFAFGGESDLNGFLYAVPKRSCKKTLVDIQNNLDGASVNGDIQVTAEEKSHTLAIVLGVIFAILIPIVGIIFGIYLMTRKDSEKAKTFGIGIIFLSVVIYAISRFLLMG